jgi:hypothetical protein
MIHSNSAASLASESAAGKLKTRSQKIMRYFTHWLRPEESRMDREVMLFLHFTDMNSVRPRISELIKSGHLEECGSIIDDVTGKRVRLVRLKQGQQRLF